MLLYVGSVKQIENVQQIIDVFEMKPFEHFNQCLSITSCTP